MNFTNPQAEMHFNYLSEKYKKLTLNKAELSHEMSVSQSSINGYIAKGYGIPNYSKIGNGKNGAVRFNIFDVAEFLAHTIKTA